MRWLRVAWIAWQCPGGLLAGLWPAAARPIICQPAPAVEDYDPARRAKAEARARDLGADLQACRMGRGCRSLTHRETVTTFDP
jgi:hypothetical protein